MHQQAVIQAVLLRGQVLLASSISRLRAENSREVKGATTATATRSLRTLLLLLLQLAPPPMRSAPGSFDLLAVTEITLPQPFKSCVNRSPKLRFEFSGGTKSIRIDSV